LTLPVSSIPILTDPLFVALIFLLALALGRRLFHILHVPSDIALWEKGFTAIALGAGVLQYIGLIAGLTKHLTTPVLGWSLVILGISLIGDILRIVKVGLSGLSRLKRAFKWNWIAFGVIFMLAPLLTAFLHAETPPTDPDGMTYHITAPKRWLEAGEITYLPTLVQTNSPMGAEMIYTLALALVGDTAAKLIHYTFGLLLILLVYFLGRKIRGPATGFAGVILLLFAIPRLGILSLMTWAYIDIAAAFMTLATLLAWMLWRDTKKTPFIILCGALAGISATMKITCLTALPVFLLLVLAENWISRRSCRYTIQMGMIFLASAILPLIPWFYRTWHLTGNPIYPALSGIFPSRDWNPRAAAWFNENNRYYIWALSKDISLAVRKSLRESALIATALAGSLILWLCKDRDARVLAFIITCYLLGNFWTTGLYMRYVIPVYPIIILFILLPLSALLEHNRYARGVALAILILGSLGYIHHKITNVAPDFAAATGWMTRYAYLEKNLPIMPVWAWVNQNSPQNARILSAASVATYYCDRMCYTTQINYQAFIPLDQWDSFVRVLKQNHIDYLIVTDGTLRDTPDRSSYPPIRNECMYMKRLATRYGRLLDHANGISLYELEW
jgi:hypothetical protein